jgi:hypothetical protein
MTRSAKLLALAGATVVALSAAAFTQTQPATPPQTQPAAPKPAGIVVGDAVTITARVEYVDVKDRVVGLRGPAGNLAFFEVDEAVKNFNRIRVGDNVKAEYFEALAVYLGKPGTQPEADAAAIIAQDPKGKRPGGFAIGAVDASATVTALDRNKRTLTVKGPEGNTWTVKVDPSVSAYEQINIGDSIHIRFIEAIAIGVTKA